MNVGAVYGTLTVNRIRAPCLRGKLWFGNKFPKEVVLGDGSELPGIDTVSDVVSKDEVSTLGQMPTLGIQSEEPEFTVRERIHLACGVFQVFAIDEQGFPGGVECYLVARYRSYHLDEEMLVASVVVSDDISSPRSVGLIIIYQ